MRTIICTPFPTNLLTWIESLPIGPLLLKSNLGQFCNDLAWSYDQPPQNHDEYDTLSDQHNAVQLVWRLEFCDHTNSLIPSWPVSVLAQTLCFENTDTLQELGTRYGWNYWQATVDLETV